MASYIQFDSGDDDGSTILVEVSKSEFQIAEDSRNDNKVGIRGFLSSTVVSAHKPFNDAIKISIRHNVKGLIEAIRDLPDPPSEVEVTFGLKATVEAGNVAVGKAGGEANYNVKLTWKK